MVVDEGKGKFIGKTYEDRESTRGGWTRLLPDASTRFGGDVALSDSETGIKTLHQAS